MAINYPVIFVPGITATELRDEYPLDHERLWGPVFKDYLRVMLHPDDTRYEAREPARVTADKVFGIVYNEFIEELRHNLSPAADCPTPVFNFPYDWRMPVEVTAERLARFVNEVMGRTRLLPHYHRAGYTDNPRINLAGHSMGGLVIAEYLSQLGPKHRVHKVVTMGTPFRGSHEAVLKVATGTADLGIPSASSREREMARVTPALYYLTPDYSGAVSAASGLTDNLFDPSAWQPGVLQSIQEYFRLYGLEKGDTMDHARKLFSMMLTSAGEHRGRVNELKLEGIGLDKTRWLAILGVGKETRVRLRIDDRQGKPHFNLSGEDRQNDWKPDDWAGRVNTGDGTVPYKGAKPPFLNTENIVCVCDDDFGYWELKDRFLEGTMVGLHASVPLMNLVQRLAVSHFSGKPFGEVWGRPAPDIGERPWSPPIEGLKMK